MGNKSKRHFRSELAMRKMSRVAHEGRVRGTTIIRTGIDENLQPTYSSPIMRMAPVGSSSKYTPHEGKKQRARLHRQLREIAAPAMSGK